MKALLIPFALIFLIIARVRNYLYDRGYFKIDSVSCKVMSIGNVTAGGTGKTPITAEIAKYLKSKGLNIGLISRGYRGKYEGVQKVPLAGANPGLYGDEPTWLAQELQVPVYVCKSKVLAAQAICEKEKVDWILADDAFQHRRLKRDLDVVILDVTESPENYFPLPVGRAREGLVSLRRANIVIFNKVNFISDSDTKRFHKIVSPLCLPHTPIVELAYEIDALLGLQKEGEWPLETLKELKVLLVSGLGRPESFESLLQKESGQIVGHLSFGDHHDYKKSDITKIEAKALALNADAIVTTQKDAVKLRSYEFSKPVFVTRLTLRREGLTDLHTQLVKLMNLQLGATIV